MGKKNAPKRPLKKANFSQELTKKGISKKAVIEQIKKTLPGKIVVKEPNEKEVKESLERLGPTIKRFHGAAFAKAWIQFQKPSGSCLNKFGYLSSKGVRNNSKLDFNLVNLSLLGDLGNLMGNAGRETGIPSSTIPGGYTFFGQFVDHDITLDVSSSLDSETDATTIPNMRTPFLDLDSLYGRGPALSPYLYVFPDTGNPTAIKLKTGENTPNGLGGPPISGSTALSTPTDYDLPRMKDTNTAIIGDPRNDENLIVSQFHHVMIKFHNQVVQMLNDTFGSSIDDIFAEAKTMVTQHYQYAVVEDFLRRICGNTAVDSALNNINVVTGDPQPMPVEFSVAAYRFGHSMIQDNYWLNANNTTQTLMDVFNLTRDPNVPVHSNAVVDFNAFFPLNGAATVNNMARKIDSVLASGLESLPGENANTILSVLATRNLRRGAALGLPSGQALATAFGITPLTSAQLTSGLSVDEVNVLNSHSGTLLNQTPLWYYILREAAVLENGDQLGPLGAKIVADTFIRMLKRDKDSYLNVTGGFTPSLASPSTTFTVSDIIEFAEVHEA